MKDDNRWKQPTCSWSNSHGSSINVVSCRSLFHRQTRISRHLLEVLRGAPPKRLCVFKVWPVSKVEMSSQKKRSFVKPSHRFLVKQHHLLIIKTWNLKRPLTGKGEASTPPKTSNFCWGVWFYPFFYFQGCILSHHHLTWCFARVGIQET